MYIRNLSFSLQLISTLPWVNKFCKSLPLLRAHQVVNLIGPFYRSSPTRSWDGHSLLLGVVDKGVPWVGVSNHRTWLRFRCEELQSEIRKQVNVPQWQRLAPKTKTVWSIMEPAHSWFVDGNMLTCFFQRSIYIVSVWLLWNASPDSQASLQLFLVKKAKTAPILRRDEPHWSQPLVGASGLLHPQNGRTFGRVVEEWKTRNLVRSWAVDGILEV